MYRALWAPQSSRVASARPLTNVNFYKSLIGKGRDPGHDFPCPMECDSCGAHPLARAMILSHGFPCYYDVLKLNWKLTHRRA